MSTKGFLRALAALLLLLAGTGALAQERIVSFHSDITINADASMVVTETIVVRSLGLQIQRGIYRDFPTRYRDRLNNLYVVGFELLQVLRDGQSEPGRVEKRSNGLRIYVGDAEVLLANGEHRYTLQYRTTRQLGFFAEHDELYWNVTGNGWQFLIEQASANVHLPVTVNAGAMAAYGYTGASGSTQQNYTSALLENGGAFTTTAPLAPQQGLTVVLQFPKGIVSAPTTVDRIGYLLQDNSAIGLGLLALLGSFAWLYHAWSRVGRDPDKGIIIPRYKAPEGFSPGACRYIWKYGYDTTTFSAAIVGLAVKGYLNIDQTSLLYTLRKSSSHQPLSAGEQVLLAGLFEQGDLLVLDQQNRIQINRVKKLHEQALRKHYKGEYFKTNGSFLLPSLMGTLLAFGLMMASGNIVPVAIILFVLTVVLHLLFIAWMRAPSRQGRLLLDKLEGLKQFLDVSEKDELNLRYAPQKTPELFEAFLPYAMALGVEQHWAERFTRVFEQRESQGQAYHPLWYTGVFHSNHPGRFTQNIGKGFTAAISVASVPPGSSSGGSLSGGGGGFSGGGGGGGGGGGW